ncbi:MAG: PDZ domain-containing protein, partial [Oligoflexales bacterium]|nr:PDZ domain-containing protein [Oligoflexales bacterium]
MADSIVQVISYIQKVNFDIPWTTKRLESKSQMGVVVSGGKILTSAYSIAFGKHFEMRLFEEASFYPLEVEFVDYNINLALLKIAHDRPPASLKPLDIGPNLQINSKVTLLTFLNRTQMQSYPLRLKSVSILLAPYSRYRFAHYIFKTEEQSLGWSEPILQNSELVALAIGQSAGDLQAIPGYIIRRFIKDAKKYPYTGFIEPGFYYEPLESPYLRHYLGADRVKGGVYIGDVMQISPFYGKLHAGDILLKIGDKQISSLGEYHHPLWGAVPFCYLFQNYSGGDAVDLTIFRDEK